MKKLYFGWMIITFILFSLILFNTANASSYKIFKWVVNLNTNQQYIVFNATSTPSSKTSYLKWRTVGFNIKVYPLDWNNDENISSIAEAYMDYKIVGSGVSQVQLPVYGEGLTVEGILQSKLGKPLPQYIKEHGGMIHIEPLFDVLHGVGWNSSTGTYASYETEPNSKKLNIEQTKGYSYNGVALNYAYLGEELETRHGTVSFDKDPTYTQTPVPTPIPTATPEYANPIVTAQANPSVAETGGVVKVTVSTKGTLDRYDSKGANISAAKLFLLNDKDLLEYGLYQEGNDVVEKENTGSGFKVIKTYYNTTIKTMFNNSLSMSHDYALDIDTGNMVLERTFKANFTVVYDPSIVKNSVCYTKTSFTAKSYITPDFNIYYKNTNVTDNSSNVLNIGTSMYTVTVTDSTKKSSDMRISGYKWFYLDNNNWVEIVDVANRTTFINSNTKTGEFKFKEVVILKNGQQLEVVHSVYANTNPTTPPTRTNTQPSVSLFVPAEVSMYDDVSNKAEFASKEGCSINYWWEISPIDGTNNVDTTGDKIDIEANKSKAIQDTVYYSKSGMYDVAIYGKYEGGLISAKGRTLVKAPVPKVVLDISDEATRKVNREVTVSAVRSESGSNPVRCSIDWTKTMCDIYPLGEGTGVSDIKTAAPYLIEGSKVVLSGENCKDMKLLFKSAGEYILEYTLFNTAGGSNSVNVTLNIKEDKRPETGISVSKTVLRNPDNSNNAVISISDYSNTKDGDILDSTPLPEGDSIKPKTVYLTSWDSDNDGSFIRKQDGGLEQWMVYSNNAWQELKELNIGIALPEELKNTGNWFLLYTKVLNPELADENWVELKKEGDVWEFYDTKISNWSKLNITDLQLLNEYNAGRLLNINSVNDDNNQSVQYSTSHVGKYRFELIKREAFGQKTINQFVTQTDRRKGNTFCLPESDKTAEVINVAPIAGFEVYKQEKKKVDVIVITDYTTKLGDIAGKLSNIQAGLIPKNVDLKYIVIGDDESEKAAIGTQTIVSILNEYARGVTLSYYKTGYSETSPPYQKIYYNNKYETVTATYETTYPPLPSGNMTYQVNTSSYNSTYNGMFGGSTHRGTRYIFNGINDPLGRSVSIDLDTYSDYSFVNGSGGSICGIADYLYSNVNWYATGWYTTGNTIQQTQNYSVKSIDFSKVTPNLIRKGSDVYILLISDANSIDYSKAWGQNYSFGGLAKGMTELVANSGASVYAAVSSTMLDTKLSASNNVNFNQDISIKELLNSSVDSKTYTPDQWLQAFDSIDSKYEVNPIKPVEMYALVGEESLKYDTYPQDYENDAIKKERWQFIHDPTFFQHPLTQVSTMPTSGTWRDNSITDFDISGKYTVTYGVTDSPTGNPTDTRFAEYNLDSTVNGKAEIIAHHRPVANFVYTFDALNNLSIVNTSYDEEHYNDPDGIRGIAESKWRWKTLDTTTWNDGLPSNSLQQGKIYEVELTVKDIDDQQRDNGVGTWSKPYARIIDTRTGTSDSGDITYNPNSSPWTNLGKTGEGKGNFGVSASVTKAVVSGSTVSRINVTDVVQTKSYTITGGSGQVNITTEGRHILDGYAVWGSKTSSNRTSGDYYLDWTTPSVTINGLSVVASTSNGWSNTNKTLNIVATDNLSGFNNAGYSLSNGTTGVFPSGVLSYSTVLELTTGIHTLSITVPDQAGNTAGGEAVYRIDTIKPYSAQFNLSNMKYNASSGNYDYICTGIDSIKVTLGDSLSGVQIAKYTWAKDKTQLSQDKLTSITGFTTTEGKSETASTNTQISNSLTGTYYLHIYQKDRAGNETYTISQPINIIRLPQINSLNVGMLAYKDGVPSVYDLGIPLTGDYYSTDNGIPKGYLTAGRLMAVKIAVKGDVTGVRFNFSHKYAEYEQSIKSADIYTRWFNCYSPFARHPQEQSPYGGDICSAIQGLLRQYGLDTSVSNDPFNPSKVSELDDRAYFNPSAWWIDASNCTWQIAQGSDTNLDIHDAGDGTKVITFYYPIPYLTKQTLKSRRWMYDMCHDWSEVDGSDVLARITDPYELKVRIYNGESYSETSIQFDVLETWINLMDTLADEIESKTRRDYYYTLLDWGSSQNPRAYAASK